MFYASYQPFTGWFLDAVAGYGSLSFNNQRFDSFDSSTVTGTRSGTEWFSSLTASTDFRTGAMKFSPYVRADLMSASLQSYAEQGASSLALTYAGVSFSSTAAVLGVRGTYDIPMSWGVLQPTGRLEFRHELDGGFNQSMFYTDLGAGQTYVLNEADAAQNRHRRGRDAGARRRAMSPPNWSTARPRATIPPSSRPSARRCGWRFSRAARVWSELLRRSVHRRA